MFEDNKKEIAQMIVDACRQDIKVFIRAMTIEHMHYLRACDQYYNSVKQSTFNALELLSQQLYLEVLVMCQNPIVFRFSAYKNDNFLTAGVLYAVCCKAMLNVEASAVECEELDDMQMKLIEENYCYDSIESVYLGNDSL